MATARSRRSPSAAPAACRRTTWTDGEEAKSHASEDQARRDLIDRAQPGRTPSRIRSKRPVNEIAARSPSAICRKSRRGRRSPRVSRRPTIVAAIKKATEDLQHASHAIAEQLYKQGQNAGTGQPQASGPSSNVKDGESSTPSTQKPSRQKRGQVGGQSGRSVGKTAHLTYQRLPDPPDPDLRRTS